MDLQFNPYSIPMFASSIFLFVMAFIVYRQTIGPVVQLFMFFVISVAAQNFAYGVELVVADFASIMTWVKIEYIFRYIPTLWLLFVLAYTGQEYWITRRNVLILSLVCLIWTLMAWTNEYHFLNWATVGTEIIEDYVLFQRTYGIGFYVSLIYDYGVTVVATIILVTAIRRSPTEYRGQIKWLLLGVTMPFIGSILTTIDLTPIPNLDLVPFGYALICLPLGWTLGRQHLLDITPMAQREVIQSIPDAVLVMDSARKIVNANPAAVELASRSGDDKLVGRTLADAFPAHQNELDYLLRTETTFSELMIEKGGIARYFEPRVSKLDDHLGKLCGYVIVLRDVTGRKRAEEIIGQNATQLEARNRELDSFSHTIAHDLKTPLSHIVGFGQLLLETAEFSTEDDRDSLRRMVQAGFKMTEMIDGLLMLAQLRDSRPVNQPVDMNVVVADAVQRYQMELDDKRFTVQVDAGLPVAYGQSLWLEEVFANLISNAIKYVGRDNKTPQLYIRGIPQADMIRYEVSDNGVGISEENRAALFDMFSRFHHGEASGLGLGLSIVLNIVTKLGGQVGVESTPQKGSTFWFTVPAVPEQEAVS